MAEMRKTSHTFCKKCKYSLSVGKGNNNRFAVTCGYLEMTNKRRGCEVGLCDKFEPKTRKGKKRR